MGGARGAIVAKVTQANVPDVQYRGLWSFILRRVLGPLSIVLTPTCYSLIYSSVRYHHRATITMMVIVPRMPQSPHNLNHNNLNHNNPSHSNLDRVSTEIQNVQDPQSSPPIDSTGEAREMPAARAPASPCIDANLATARGGRNPDNRRRGQKKNGGDDSGSESDDGANVPGGPGNGKGIQRPRPSDDIDTVAGADGRAVKKPWWKLAARKVSKGAKKAFRMDGNRE